MLGWVGCQFKGAAIRGAGLAGALLPGAGEQRDRVPIALRSRSDLSWSGSSTSLLSAPKRAATRPQCSPDQREQSGHLRLGRHKLVEQADQPFPVLGKVPGLPVPVIVELILRRTLHLRSEFHDAGDDRVDVLHVDEQRRRRARKPAGRRCLGPVLRTVVAMSI